MSIRRARELRSPRTGDVYPDDDVDPGRFFGDGKGFQRGNRKVLQLCKQVEQSAAFTLTGACETEALLGAAVAAVEPAPDSGRLRVVVVLGVGKDVLDVAEANAALRRKVAVFREEVGRSIHRKRVPELVFDVRLGEEVARG